MKENTLRYQNLIDTAKTFEYYSTVTTGEQKEYWIEQAKLRRAQAESLPEDYVDPEWRMPEWGTYGT